MAFKLSEFKKTTRGSGESRQIYPHQIRDERHTAAISFAVAYFERMAGRRRADFEREACRDTRPQTWRPAALGCLGAKTPY